jgi:mono/diheme cytochrome c family protein
MTVKLRILCVASVLAAFQLTTGMVTVSSADNQAPGAAAERKTVWDGVYSEAQAARGRGLYSSHCAVCHRDDLSGGSDTGGGGSRALAGARFWQDWGDDSLESIFGRMSSAMPASAPGTLGEAVYLDILSYILQQNEFPSGARELTREVIPSVRIVAKDGKPQPLLNGTIVSVVGCLKGAAGKWTLFDANDPAKSRDPYPKGPIESSDVVLGTQVFELTDVFPEPTAHAGHKMEARGFLGRGQGGTRAINVTSLRIVAESCEK